MINESSCARKETVHLHMLINKKQYQKPNSRNFWRIANRVRNKGKSAIHLLECFDPKMGTRGGVILTIQTFLKAKNNFF